MMTFVIGNSPGMNMTVLQGHQCHFIPTAVLYTKSTFIAKAYGFNHVGAGIDGDGGDVKEAWKERAHKLNQQPLQGKFQVLPAAYAAMTPADTLSLMKICLLEDLARLRKTLDSALRHNNQQELKLWLGFLIHFWLSHSAFS
eukprot:11882412-Ditylum_brightwellii.AAC.1